MRPNRKSPRLKDFDYAEDGAYFVTICSHEMKHLFGRVDKNGEMQLNVWGRIAQECWQAIPNHFNNAELDLFVIMPNHMHRIVFLQNERVIVGERQCLSSAPETSKYHVKQGSLLAIVGSYKSVVTRRINEIRRVKNPPIWQRSFWDNIIRNETRLNEVRQYTLNNPAQWAEDRFYSEA